MISLLAKIIKKNNLFTLITTTLCRSIQMGEVLGTWVPAPGGIRRPLCSPVEGGINLVRRLEEEAHSKYDITYEGYLANHLSHGLYSICALGASLERIQNFYTEYTSKLEPARRAKFLISNSNWEKYINEDKSFSEYLPFFDSEVDTLGPLKSLEKWFPKLNAYSVGAAFHPLIHIGYAVEFQDKFVLSEGFSYACQTPQLGAEKVLKDFENSSASTSGAEWDGSVTSFVEEMKSLSFTIPEDVGNFHHKIEYVLNNLGDNIASILARWDLSSPSIFSKKLNELTEASILGTFATYSNKIDFFLLHGITANHAVRQILPHLSTDEEKRRLLRLNLIGFLSTYLVQKSPKIDVSLISSYQEEPVGENGWDDIIKKGYGNDEEHVPKVVRSLIYFMETVPGTERSGICGDENLRKCGFKAVNILKDGMDGYIF